MATAGIFLLITNDGKQDRMLMASSLLKQRLNAITVARKEAGFQDTTPTLLDIERSHVLFMNAHFKPFAAMAFEYNKVRPEGAPVLGATVRFSIPQFGDFFNDMALYVRFDPLTYTPVAAAPNQDVFRYCDFPGERLCKNVKFHVNGNPLDEYTRDCYNMNRQFCLMPHKETGYKRLVGQEVPSEAYFQQQTLTQPTGRVKLNYCNGYQTPAATHPALEVMVPLMFWFNDDPRLAIPSVSIPYGQRFLEIELATSAELVGLVVPPGSAGGDTGVLAALTIREMSLYVNNIFVNPEVHDIFIKRIGFSLIRVHRIQKVRVDKDNSSILLNTLKWPTEILYIAIKPVENETAVGGNGVGHYENWHRFGKITDDVKDVDGVASCRRDTVAAAEIAAFVAIANGGVTAVAQQILYAALPKTTAAAQALYAAIQAPELTGDPAATANAAGALYIFNIAQAAATAAYRTHPVLEGECASMETKLCSRTVEKLSIQAHGIDLYKEFPGEFYNSFVPYTFGGANIRTPEDCSAYMITFALYPKSYQPSGHVNISRAREFYLQYWSGGVISTAAQADLLVIAQAINFLLISDGSAVLRYST